MCKKDYIWNPATCSYKNGKCLASTVDNSVIRCDEVIKETKAATTKFTEKKCNLRNKKFLYSTCLFINYHCTIDNC